MYERFSDRARKVVQLANQEAHRLNHEYIGTEHILLGLVKEGEGVAAHVLKNLGVDLKKVRFQVEKIVQFEPKALVPGRLPQTPRTKWVIECAVDEARNLNHNHVGTEHLLLGLVRDGEGVAAQVLVKLGLQLDRVRKEVREFHRASGWSSSVSIVERIGRWTGREMGEFLSAKSGIAALGSGSTAAQTVDRTNAEKILHLQRQFSTVRFLLGAILGAGAGVVFGDRIGLVAGLLTGCCVALVGRRLPAILAGGATGGFFASGQFDSDIAGLVGAVGGALLAVCVVEIGRVPEA